MTLVWHMLVGEKNAEQWVKCRNIKELTSKTYMNFHELSMKSWEVRNNKKGFLISMTSS